MYGAPGPPAYRTPSAWPRQATARTGHGAPSEERGGVLEGRWGALVHQKGGGKALAHRPDFKVTGVELSPPSTLPLPLSQTKTTVLSELGHYPNRFLRVTGRITTIIRSNLPPVLRRHAVAWALCGALHGRRRRCAPAGGPLRAILRAPDRSAHRQPNPPRWWPGMHYCSIFFYYYSVVDIEDCRVAVSQQTAKKSVEAPEACQLLGVREAISGCIIHPHRQ